MARSIYITSAEGHPASRRSRSACSTRSATQTPRVGVFRPIARSTRRARLRARAAARPRRRRPRLRRVRRRHLRRRARRPGCRARAHRRAVQGGRGAVRRRRHPRLRLHRCRQPDRARLQRAHRREPRRARAARARRARSQGRASARPADPRTPDEMRQIAELALARARARRTPTLLARRRQPRRPGRSSTRSSRRDRGIRRTPRRATFRSGRSPRTRSSSRRRARRSCAAVDGDAAQGRPRAARPRGARRRRRRHVDGQRAAAAHRGRRRRRRRPTAPRCCSRRCWRNASGTFPSLAGIVLNGGFDAARRRSSGSSTASARRCRSSRPTSAPTTPRCAITSTRGRLAADSQRKYDTALALFEQHVDADELLRAARASPRPTVVTPLMFEYELIERARADAQAHRAARGRRRPHPARGRAPLLQRGIADLTILGERGRGARARDRARPRHRRRAQVLEPVRRRAARARSPRSTRGCARTRASPSTQAARHRHRRLVLRHDDGAPRPRRRHGLGRRAHDGAHHPARRSRSSRPRPGVSVVSSVFLMALADRVLVYGDCAVIPDPTAEQLADIAISSAATAAPVRHRAARRDAVVLDGRVRHRRRRREGARGDRAGARARAPTCSSRARSSTTRRPTPPSPPRRCRAPRSPGRATVFIFPDLNTGNNTYKAVQRSRRRGRDRAGAAGPQQADQRPLARRARATTSSTPSRSPRSRRRRVRMSTVAASSTAARRRSSTS